MFVYSPVVRIRMVLVTNFRPNTWKSKSKRNVSYNFSIVYYKILWNVGKDMVSHNLDSGKSVLRRGRKYVCIARCLSSIAIAVHRSYWPNILFELLLTYRIGKQQKSNPVNNIFNTWCVVVYVLRLIHDWDWLKIWHITCKILHRATLKKQLNRTYTTI